MGTIRSFHRRATEDFPLEVSYFSPYHINQTPGFTETGATMRISLILDGQVDVRIEGKTYILNKGDIFIILPYEIFTFRSMSMETKYVFLDFSLDLIAMPQDHFFQQKFVGPLTEGKLTPPRLIRPGDQPHDALYQLLSRLDINKEGTDAYTAELYAITVSLCAVLFPYCTTTTPKVLGKAGEDVIYTCLEYIKENYANKITLQEMADIVHLQPNYLCSIFKKRTGRTIFDHITRRRINYSSKLLRSTKLPVNEIAEQCGFPSISFYTRKFSALHGCSPTDYRKQFAERDLTEI